MECVAVGPVSVLPPGASSGMSDTEPDIQIYLLIYKFVNFFEKSACTVLES